MAKLLSISKIFYLIVIMAGITMVNCSQKILPYNLSQTQISQVNQTPEQTIPTQSQQWRLMNEAEKEETWRFILNSPMGVAALNQLAIEGFISPNCPKTFYFNEKYGGFQTLLEVKCPTARGVSIALDYKVIRVVFNRFEDNIENFQIERFPE